MILCEKATKHIFVNKYWFDRKTDKLHFFYSKTCTKAQGAKQNVYLKRKQNGEKICIRVKLKQMV